MDTNLERESRSSAISASVLSARVRYLLVQSPIGIMLSPLGSLTVSRAIAGEADWSRLLIWNLGMLLLAALRLAVYSWAHKRERRPQVVGNLLGASILLVALWWGLGGVFILPGSSNGNLLVYCALMVMLGGTAALYSVHPWATAASILAIAGPISWNFLFVQQETSLQLMGAGAVLYTVGCLRGVQSLNHFLVRSHELTYDLEANVRLLERSEEMRRDLTLMLIHDLRTPLSALITRARLAREYNDEGDRDSSREALIQTEDLSLSLVRMVSSILDVNRLESDQFPLAKSPVAVEELIELSLDGLGSLSDRVRVEGPEGLSLVCDPELLTRVIMNLLSNAFRYQPADKPVNLRYRLIDGKLELRVQDDGPGVARQDQTRIFDKYAQASRPSRGYTSGLGLTFSKLAIERHNGQIGVSSQLGQGAEFWIRLPGCVRGML